MATKVPNDKPQRPLGTSTVPTGATQQPLLGQAHWVGVLGVDTRASREHSSATTDAQSLAHPNDRRFTDDRQCYKERNKTKQ